MLVGMDADRFEFGSYVHVDDVAIAVSRALETSVPAHLRITLSTSGDVDASRARAVCSHCAACLS